MSFLHLRIFGSTRTAALLVLAMVLASAGPASAQRDRNRRPKPVKSGGSKAKGQGDHKSPESTGGEDDESKHQCIKKKGRFHVNLADEVELKDLITWAMTFRCENFVYGTNIGGRNSKVIVVAPKQMTAGQAWRLFLVSLQNMGLTVVRKGNTLEIVESPTAKKSALPVYRGGVPATDQVVRAILRPEHLSAGDLANILNKMSSKDGSVEAVAGANVIVITDFGSHISRMRRVARSVDRPASGERLYYIKVRYADATELSTKLTELLGTKNAGANNATRNNNNNRRNNRRNRNRNRDNNSSSSTSKAEVEAALPSKITADERTNALIVLASKAAYLRVKSLAKRLDVPVDVEGAGRIHVYVLQHADAEEMAQTLTAAISGIQTGGNARGGANNNNRNNRNRNRTPARPSTGGTTGDAAFEGQVRVTHDQPSNALIVVASVKDFLSLREVIRRLDSPRPQVYIEATIVEVNLNNNRDLGFSYHGGAEANGGAVILGGLQSSQLSTLGLGVDASALLGVQGLLGGALGTPIEATEEILGVSIPSFGILFQALALSEDVNILSSPHIMTTDNQEAEISVGQNIPYRSANVAVPGAGAGLGAFTAPIQRQDVALTLKVTPQINASDSIRLDIDLEISDIAARDFEGNGPSWSKRTIKNTVVVQDQEPVVIGGLVREQETNSETKIPLLGDIPILGYLFKFNSKSKTKTNLLVMLTPHVVKDQVDLARIRERRVRETREFADSIKALDDMGKNKDYDYRRKSGLLQEINSTVSKIDDEVRLRRELQQQLIEFPDGPIEYDTEEQEKGPTPTPSDTKTGDSAQPKKGKRTGKAAAQVGGKRG